MSDPTPHVQTILTLRLIYGAMAAGVVGFGVVVVFVLRPQPDPRSAEVLVATLGALGVAEIVAWVVGGRIARQRLQLRIEAVPAAEGEAILLRGYYNLSVVAAALAEAFCFYGLIVHLLTASGVALVAAAAGLAVILGRLPSGGRYERFADALHGRRPV